MCFLCAHPVFEISDRKLFLYLFAKIITDLIQKEGRRKHPDDMSTPLSHPISLIAITRQLPKHQIIPPHDLGIAAAILEELELWPLTAAEEGNSREWFDPMDAVSKEYYSRLMTMCFR